MSNPIVNIHSNRACPILHNRIQGISYPHSGVSILTRGVVGRTRARHTLLAPFWLYCLFLFLFVFWLVAFRQRYYRLVFFDVCFW